MLDARTVGLQMKFDVGGLTLGEFENGIRYWREHTKWPKDLHNQFYLQLDRENCRSVFDEAWWQSFLDHLRRWRATRPYSGAVLSERAERVFPALGEAWTRSCVPYLDLDIADVRWEQVHAFAGVVQTIKPVSSPVFTSKFCHFLAPKIFPVADGAVLGREVASGTYGAHFSKVREEWLATPSAVQQMLETRIAALVGAPLAPNFPMKNKLVELCLIGRRARGLAQAT